MRLVTYRATVETEARLGALSGDLVIDLQRFGAEKGVVLPATMLEFIDLGPQAVAIANDSPYGLSAQVYGADVAAATQVARRLRTGAVNVNASLFSAYAPSGGYKQSGLGRERGPDGIRAFQEVKHMAIGELR